MKRHHLALFLMLAVGALGACARPDSVDGIPTAGDGQRDTEVAAQASADPQERGRQFAACMRENGIDMPDPEVQAGGKTAIRIGGEGTDKSKIQAAMEKCRQFLPNGGQPRQLSAEELEKLREHAKCMRENGVPDFPDPDPNVGGIRIQMDEQNEAAIEAAMEKCRQHLPEAKVGGKTG